MTSVGYAIYDPDQNRLKVVRPSENSTRYIRCTNLNPKSDHVFGVQIEGDEIWVLVGPKQNQRPNRKIGYRFSSLSGGYSRMI
jgi:hypothetical protein